MSSKLESERRLFYVALTRARKGVLIGASENASRFLNEIQLRDTDAVMGAVQHLASGEANSAVILRQALQACNIPPSLLNNLISGYLPDMGHTQLANQIQRDFQFLAQSVEISVQ
jgi:ATP-dependent exoDNAse (exonuclease V) beta subunit